MSETFHYVRRRPADARKSILKASRTGGLSLVLGAGVSFSRGLPTWPGLVRALWSDLRPARPIPPWLAETEPSPHPLAYQILLEEIEGALRWEISQENGIRPEEVSPAVAQERLVGRISERLYATDVVDNPSDTLGVVVEVLRGEQRRANRHVMRVITFNADDLLERSANRDTDAGRAPVLHPVPRGSFHPRHGSGAFGRSPIDVYHLHGFIPRSPQYRRGAPDTLVFTDAQYWDSMANPTSFANRVMSNAMQDSKCIFIGMSMTDINMMRWLGLRFVEFLADRRSYYDYHDYSTASADQKAREALSRHYWICTEADDPTRLIASHLERRGVTTVTLPSWGEPFEALMRECFGGEDRAG